MEAPGARVGPFRVLDVIGRGGMGVVYRAVHPATGEVVALKTLQRSSEALLACFRREIHALSRLTHRGVVRIVDEGVEEAVPWYAMELIDGVAMRHLVDPRAPEGLGAALTIVRRLCAPLGMLHGEGLVHRDLKPENVLVREDGTPVLLDFGLVSRFGGGRNREALDVGGTGIGTIAYAAPEHALGELVDARADLYSLGCMLYELVTGRPPFVGPLAKVIMGHVSEAPVPPSEMAPGVSPELDDLVLRLLAKDPRERLGYAADVDAVLASLGAEGWPEPPTAARSYLYRPGFAGRSEHVAYVEQRLAALASGSGGLLFVGGVSGAGKTRFAIEIARRASEGGTRVLVGECAPGAPVGDGANALPFGALRKPIEALVDRCRERGRRESARLLGPNAHALAPYAPAVASLDGVGDGGALAELPADAARLRLFSIVADALVALSEDDPVLLVLDDLQWADGLTLAFLEFAARARRFVRARVLLVGLHRSDEGGQGLRLLLDAPGTERFELNRLDRADVSAIVRDMLALPAPPGDLSAFLLEASDGNPFFVAEYLRTAVDEGMLSRDVGGRWGVVGGATGQVDFAGLGLPGTLRDLVERRLTGLPDDARALAEAISVFGREAELVLAREAAGLDERTALEAAAELLRRYVVEEPRAGALRFAHDTLRERSYKAIETARLPALHRAVAEGLEARGSEPHAVLARHWQEAGEPERARPHYLTAAREARDQHAFDEAEALYRSCLALGSGSDLTSLSTRTELAHDVLRVTGRGADALPLLDEALGEAQRLGERRSESAVLRSIGIVSWETGRVEVSIEALEAALEIARSIGDRRLEAETLDALANVVADRGPIEDAHGLYRLALRANADSGNRGGEGITMSNLAALEYHRGRFDEARRLCETAIAIHRESGNRRFEAMTTVHLAILRHVGGDPCAAHRLFEDAGAIQREIGDRRNEGITLQNLGVSLYREKRFQEGRSSLRRALAIHRDVGNVRYEAIACTELAAIERHLGGYDEARALLKAADAALHDLGDHLNLAMCTCERGHLALAEGEAGRPYLEAASALFVGVHGNAESDLGFAVANLSRAVAWSESGRTLVHGEVPPGD